MTHDEILSMQPGRELDALVAEKVMGWTKLKCKRIGGCLKEQFGPDHRCKCDSDRYAPDPYSTDVSAAWEVQDKLQQYGGLVIGCYGAKNGARWFTAQTMVGAKEISITCHIAPEAICKAALLTVMEVNT